MPVQFAVLASGSRGNSTLIRGRGAGLLIDVGIGAPGLAGAAGRALGRAGRGWRRVVLTHTHGDHVNSGSFPELARRRISVHCHEGHRGTLETNPGFRRLEEAGLISCYDEQPVLTSTGLRLEPIRLRHDGGPTFGFRIEVVNRAPRKAGEHRLSCGHRELVREHGGQPGRCRPPRGGVQSRRGHAEGIRPFEGLDCANLGDHGHLSNRQGPRWSRPSWRDRDAEPCGIWSCST